MANDQDGTPLGKADTIAWQDTTTMKEDAAKVSVADAYAKGSGYTEAVDKPVKQTFRERVKQTISEKVSNAKTNVNRAMDKGVIQSAKEYGGTALKYAKQGGQNALENLGEDTRYLGQQTKSSVRNIGLSEKQSAAKYGDLQYPSLFGGQGGYADTVTHDRTPKKRIKQVSGFSEVENKGSIFENMQSIDLFKSGAKEQVPRYQRDASGKYKRDANGDKILIGYKEGKRLGHNPMDIFANNSLNPKTAAEKRADKLKRQRDRYNAGKKAKPVNRDITSMKDPLSGMFQTGGAVKKTKNGSMNNINSMGSMGDIFSNMGKSQIKISKKPTKVLKQKKTNISNMNNMNDIFKMNMFGKKKKGGLF